MANGDRPDPDKLLAEINDEATAAERGKLKVFFGACAGVGKTYTMLNAAQQRLAEGVDVVVGVVETHGRDATSKLLENLPILELRKIDYRGSVLREFDVDAALQRAPQLIIVDELAHSNAVGSRHAKRWQDVDELLTSGIDVYTTLNVQHIDSLNDVVGSITGIRVWETVPDRFFNQANDVTLVDLPPDELLERLQGGKVYLPEQAKHAAKNFFRKGNLIALRELALRRTADRVDSQMRAYRTDSAIANVWEARERLLVCIGPDTAGDKLVRSAARLASDLKADWIAVYVETPELQRLSKEDRQRILDHLQLAEELGAETVTLTGSDLIATLSAYARSRNANKLVIGRPSDLPWHQRLQRRFVEALTRRAADLDIYIVGIEASVRFKSHTIKTYGMDWRSYMWASVACAGATAVSVILAHIFDLSNIVMVYLLMVVSVSARLGRGPSAWAAALSVLLFDFFFVPPKYTFAIADPQYLFTFAMMLLVALFIGQLASNLRFEATIANLRERRAEALGALSKELSGALVTEQVVEIANRHVSGMFAAKVATLLPDSQEKIQIAGTSANAPTIDLAVAQWVYDRQQPAGFGTHTLSAAVSRYMPLQAPMRTRGVLVLEANNPQLFEEPEEKRLLDTFAAQIALALERIHYVEVAQGALVSMEGDRLRNSLLSAISRDLRNPLNSLVKLTRKLNQPNSNAGDAQQLTNSIQNEAQNINELVTNLLDMAQLQSGGVKLKKAWHNIADIINKAALQLNHALTLHNFKITLPENLPQCECDADLMQRVIFNLLDNACKYTPQHSNINLSANASDDKLTLIVDDNGPGLPPGQEIKLFDKFARGDADKNKPGIGLGLSLCKIIVMAHNGKISAENRTSGGARFTVTLPLGTIPKSETEA